MKAWLQRFPEVWLVVLLWLVVHLFGYISKQLWPIEHEYLGFPWLFENASLWSYFATLAQTWDSVHFFRIASEWYAPIDHIGGTDYLYAFFPLYPALVAVVGLVVQNTTLAMVILSLVLPIGMSILIKKFLHDSSLSLIRLR